MAGPLQAMQGEREWPGPCRPCKASANGPLQAMQGEREWALGCVASRLTLLREQAAAKGLVAGRLDDGLGHGQRAVEDGLIG